MQHPGQRDLRGRNIPLLRQLSRAIGHHKIGSLIIHFGGIAIRLGTNRLAAAGPRSIAGQKAACQRTPRDNANTLVEAQRQMAALAQRMSPNPSAKTAFAA